MRHLELCVYEYVSIPAGENAEDDVWFVDLLVYQALLDHPW